MSELRIGVIGAGVMGGGIAQSTAAAGFETVCTDLASEALEAARREVAEGRFGLAGAVARGKLSAADADAARVVEEGVATHEQVNQLMVDCYRWPVGPFAMVKGAVSGWREAGK